VYATKLCCSTSDNHQVLFLYVNDHVFALTSAIIQTTLDSQQGKDSTRQTSSVRKLDWYVVAFESQINLRACGKSDQPPNALCHRQNTKTTHKHSSEQEMLVDERRKILKGKLPTSMDAKNIETFCGRVQPINVASCKLE
jgi:hypothetical protein